MTRRPHPLRSPAAVLAAVLLLGGAARADKVDELNAALLGDPSYKVKVQAALVLGKLNDRRAVPALLEALRDDNDTVRGMAALSLGKLGDPRAVDGLTRIKGDSSDFVRANVAKALATLGGGPSEGPPGGARHFVAVRISSRAAAPGAEKMLADATLAEVAKLPRVSAAPEHSAPTAQALSAKRMSGWILDGTLSLKVSGAGSSAQLDCDVSAAIATWPQHSIKATSSAGASIPGVRTTSDLSAQRQCFEAVAQGLADDVGKFLRSQP